ncbi:hypothetical protein A7Q10_04185 [Methylacidiphilum caldifontis]|uniref:Uncharacterized protein n=1 Tax=Methylacidiphilum caldifontis TaxID=2795386 RepID=A0A4Y8PHA4_9BACT|nr:hypothetical protein A7Q10_04185 [Methylacidiphilum caldifontis]
MDFSIDRVNPDSHQKLHDLMDGATDRISCRRETRYPPRSPIRQPFSLVFKLLAKLEKNHVSNGSGDTEVRLKAAHSQFPNDDEIKPSHRVMSEFV